MFKFFKYFIFFTGCWNLSLLTLVSLVKVLELSYRIYPTIEPITWLVLRILITGGLYYYFCICKRDGSD